MRCVRLGLAAGFICIFGALAGAQGSIEIPSESTPSIRSLEAKHYSSYAMGTAFADIVAQGNIKGKEIIQAKTVPTTVRNGGASTEKDVWLHVLAGNADVVVIGRPGNRSSALVDTGTFVFSDYQLQIDTVLMARRCVLNAGQTIIVSRAGGWVRQDPWVFRAIDPEFHLFREGERYLLFLRRLPETNTFVVGASGTFLLQDGKVISGATHSLNMPQMREEEDFMKSVWSFTNQEGARR